MPLLVFHLALIALVLLAAVGRLMYLKGTAEVMEGTAFSGLKFRDNGPLHLDRLEKVRFINEGFDIDYMAGPVLDRIVNRVRWQDGRGGERVGKIELNKPLILFGYRIYPTSNKGFAPLFAWRSHAGEAMLAAVHLPGYPANASNQAQTWRPIGSTDDIWIMLQIEEELIPSDRASHFKLPDRQDIIVRHQQSRWELRPGDRVTLPGGELEYRGLRTWMGYRFFYDWTIPWMLAACAIGVASLSWHFWRKYASTPWNKDK